MRFIRTANRTN